MKDGDRDEPARVCRHCDCRPCACGHRDFSSEHEHEETARKEREAKAWADNPWPGEGTSK